MTRSDFISFAYFTIVFVSLAVIIVCKVFPVIVEMEPWRWI